MDIILFLIKWILGLGLIALPGWGIWICLKNPSKVNDLFQKVTEPHHHDGYKVLEKTENKPSQEELIRMIVKEEMGRMGNKIIQSFPHPVDINQSDIINEIIYNRRILERLVTSLDKKPEKIKSEPIRIDTKQYPIIKYARMVDSFSPIGFRMLTLSDISKGACYQITILSERQACYHLITDSTIQREIIAMFNPIITSGCEYEDEPTAINEIMHLEDGLLELHSDIWHIVRKAKIKFI